MFKKRYIEALSKVAVFDGLQKEELELFSGFCKRVPFKEDEILIKEGQTASAFYILVKGQLKVFLPEKIEGRKERRIADVDLNILKEGDWFGEYSLITQSPASASIIATQSGEVLRIPADDFTWVLKDNDRVASVVYFNLIRVLIKRLKKQEREYDQVLIVG